MVYSREAHTPRGSTAAYRAAGWLAGGPAKQQYRVLAAGLGPGGRQAALLVQGVQASSTGIGGTADTALKVFAADGYGHWSDVCSIPLSDAQVQSGVCWVSVLLLCWARLAGSKLMAHSADMQGCTPHSLDGTHCKCM